MTGVVDDDDDFGESDGDDNDSGIDDDNNDDSGDDNNVSGVKDDVMTKTHLFVYLIYIYFFNAYLLFINLLFSAC